MTTTVVFELTPGRLELTLVTLDFSVSATKEDHLDQSSTLLWSSGNLYETNTQLECDVSELPRSLVGLTQRRLAYVGVCPRVIGEGLPVRLCRLQII